MPSSSNKLPKVYRGTPWIASSPTKATIRPIQPEIHPFNGSSPDVMVPQMAIPHIANRNISQERNWSANARMIGIKAISSKMPTQLPIKEATMAVPSARPPSPLWARGCPSIIVGTLSGVPGMFIRTAEMAPPNTLPVYTPSMNMIATYCSMPAESPMSRAMAMVVDSPGIAPQRIPSVTPVQHISSM